MAVTVVAIVVELAATRYSHEITRLFLEDPINLGVLGLFVLTTVLCLLLGVVLTFLLSSKQFFHSFAARVSREDFYATVKFLIVAVIVTIICLVFLFHLRSALVAIVMLPIGVLIAMLVAWRRNRKLIAAGVVHVDSDRI